MDVTVNLIVLFLYCANGVRISPKLDFGDTSSTRPIFSTANYNEGFASRPNFRTYESSVHNIDCIGNNCETKTVKSDSSGSVSADVVVHIKTNLDIPKTRNETSVPDVPVIVGSNGPFYPENAPIPVPYPMLPPTNVDPIYSPPLAGINPNYPPSSIDVNTIPELNRRGFIPRNIYRGFNGYTHSNNGFNFDNYDRRSLPVNWYPQPREEGSSVHNPLEFKKIYKNVWPTGFENEWTFRN